MGKLISFIRKIITFMSFFMVTMLLFGCRPEVVNDESGPLVKPPVILSDGAAFISAFNSNSSGIKADGGASWFEIKISDIEKLQGAGDWKVYVATNKYSNILMSSSEISWSLSNEDVIRIHSKDYTGMTDQDISENNSLIWDYKTTSQHFASGSNGIIWIEDGFGNIMDIFAYTTEFNSSSYWLSSEGTNPLRILMNAVNEDQWTSSELAGAFVITDSTLSYSRLIDNSTNGNSAADWEEIIEPTILLTSAKINPKNILAGEETPVLVTVDVSAFGGAAFDSIEVDLSSIGGNANTAMYDDGTNGDETSSDGTYSVSSSAANTLVVGEYSVVISTVNSSLGSEETVSASLTVVDEIQSTNRGIYISAICTDGKGTHSDAGGAWLDLKVANAAALAEVGEWKVYTGNFKYVNQLMSSSDVDWILADNNTIRIHSNKYTGTTDTDISENNNSMWDYKTASGYFADFKYAVVWIEDASGNILDMLAYTTDKNSNDYWLSSQSANPLGKLQTAVIENQWNGETISDAFVFAESSASYAKLKDDSTDGNSASDWEEVKTVTEEPVTEEPVTEEKTENQAI